MPPAARNPFKKGFLDFPKFFIGFIIKGFGSVGNLPGNCPGNCAIIGRKLTSASFLFELLQKGFWWPKQIFLKKFFQGLTGRIKQCTIYNIIIF
jgi:hypothetical protein